MIFVERNNSCFHFYYSRRLLLDFFVFCVKRLSQNTKSVDFSHQLKVVLNDFFIEVPPKAFHHSLFNLSKQLQTEYRLVKLILVPLVTYV